MAGEGTCGHDDDHAAMAGEGTCRHDDDHDADWSEDMSDEQESNELAETLGRKIATIELNGQSFTLRALNLNDLVELEQEGGGNLQQTRCELYLAARRGGYSGSLEEIGGLVQWETLEEIEETLKSLWPPLARRRAEVMKQIRMRALGIEQEPEEAAGDSSGS